MKNKKFGLLGAYLISVLIMMVVLVLPVVGIIWWVGQPINLLTICTMLVLPSAVSGVFVAFTLHLKKIREESMEVEELEGNEIEGESENV